MIAKVVFVVGLGILFIIYIGCSFTLNNLALRGALYNSEDTFYNLVRITSLIFAGMGSVYFGNKYTPNDSWWKFILAGVVLIIILSIGSGLITSSDKRFKNAGIGIVTCTAILLIFSIAWKFWFSS